MKSTFTFWSTLTLLALLLPGLYLLAKWPHLPAIVPTHFSASGHANGYGSKWLLVGLVAGLPGAVWMLMYYLPRIDPKRVLSAANPNYQKLRLLVQLPLAMVGIFTVHAAADSSAAANFGKWLPILILLFLSFIGNYLTTVQPNYFVGIRTPWTLESPTVWAQTHRVGGRLFFWSGLLGALLTLALPTEAGLVIVVVLALGLSLGLAGYSYLLYQRKLTAAKPHA